MTMTEQQRLAAIADAIDAARPAIRNDGGDIELVSADDKRVYVRLKGRCTTCAFAMQTLGGIRRRLMKTLDKPVLVVPYED
jgi:Fe-S cluster biogenesis protein NfuA